MPRVGRGKKDYNMAMDPALLNAGKIVAAAEDRNLATLLRSLLREHIEKASPEQAKHIYETAAEVPHGTQIDRFGPTRTIALQLPIPLLNAAKSQAATEERSVASLTRRAIERYLEECRAGDNGTEVVPPESEGPIAGQLDIVSELAEIEGSPDVVK